MKKQLNFKCLLNAVTVPYKENYEVDEDAYRKLLRYFLQPKFKDAGGAIVVNPHAGEPYSLTRQEKRRNLEIALEECGENIHVLAGVLSVDDDEAVKLAKDAKEMGVDGIYVCPNFPMELVFTERFPDYTKKPDVYLNYLKSVVDAADLPAITVPIASMVPNSMLPQHLELCARVVREIPNISAFKMTWLTSTGMESYEKAYKVFSTLDRPIASLCAAALYFHDVLAAGYFDGAMSGGFNYSMESLVDLINAWKRGDEEKGNEIWGAGLGKLQEYVYADLIRFHLRYKEAAWMRGLIPLPFPRPAEKLELQRDELLTLRNCLIQSGFEVIPEKDMNRVIAQLP